MPSKFNPTIQFNEKNEPSHIADDSKVTAAEQAYIKTLRIPPVWKNVVLTVDPKSHIAAIGYDKDGRRQYIYTAFHWSEVTRAKYLNLITFGEKLNLIRTTVDDQLTKKDSPKKQVAAVVKLLFLCMLRLGTDANVEKYKSFGLTTLQARHVRIHKNEVFLSFIGKKGVQNTCGLSLADGNSEPLARYLLELKKKAKRPRSWLFEFEGEKISFKAVNGFLKKFGNITSKFFRTWAANVLFLQNVLKSCSLSKITKRKKLLSTTIKTKVAPKLNHTPAICKKSYMMSELMQLFVDDPSTLREISGINTSKIISKTEAEQAFMRILKWNQNKAKMKSFY